MTTPLQTRLTNLQLTHNNIDLGTIINVIQRTQNELTRLEIRVLLNAKTSTLTITIPTSIINEEQYMDYEYMITLIKQLLYTNQHSYTHIPVHP